MSGPKAKGWARGGSVEAVKSSVLILILLVIDVWIFFFGVMQGKTPAIEISVALMFLNVLIIGLSGHWAILASIRKGMWTKTYPLAETTVLDSIEGYLDKERIAFQTAGEEHTYTENYSDVLRCGMLDKKKTGFSIKLRPVSFPEQGVAILVGPEEKRNAQVIRKFLVAFDDVVEDDLKEGVSRVSKKGKKIEEEE